MRLNDIVNDQISEGPFDAVGRFFKGGTTAKTAAAGDEPAKAAVAGDKAVAAGADAPEAAFGAGKIEVPTSSGGGARTPGEQARIQAAASPNAAVRQAADPFNLAGKQGDEMAQAATKTAPQAAGTADDAAQAARKVVDPKKAAAAGAVAGAVGVGMLGGSTAQDPNKPDATGGASSQEDIDKMSFGQAFKAARTAAKAAGHEATGQFTWRGKPYQTNVQGEPYVPMNQQKKVSISAPKAAPAPGATAPAQAPAPTQAQTPANPEPVGASTRPDVQAAAQAGNAQVGDNLVPKTRSMGSPASAQTNDDNPEAAMGAGSATPTQAAAPAATGGTRSTTSSQNVSGTLKMGRADGPIQYNGQTVNPGDPNYAAAEQALIAAGQRRQQMRTQMSRDWQAQQRAASGAAPAPVQQGASLGSRDFEESLDRLKQLWQHKG